jgi:hypothetical protein
MRKLLLLAFLAMIGFAHYAHAATLNFSMTFTGPNSNTPACTEVSPAPVLPLAVGTLVATCVITPSTWSGMLNPLAGADAGLFTGGLTGTNININVGSSPITVNRTYNISITTTP